MKFIVYQNRRSGPGAPTRYEVRTDPGETTIARCATRDEAKRIAHALNTAPKSRSTDELLQSIQEPAEPPPLTRTCHCGHPYKAHRTVGFVIGECQFVGSDRGARESGGKAHCLYYIDTSLPDKPQRTGELAEIVLAKIADHNQSVRLARLPMDTFEKVAESNRIEGITRPPTEAEIQEHERFVRVETISLSELENFVRIYQPNARLRSIPGLNVRVGAHIPPKGGEHIVAQLQGLVIDINAEKVGAWDAHLQYEMLHPFTDGNGRSGRAIWYWQMRNSARADLGFLHAFYYQTLNKCATSEDPH